MKIILIPLFTILSASTLASNGKAEGNISKLTFEGNDGRILIEGLKTGVEHCQAKDLVAIENNHENKKDVTSLLLAAKAMNSHLTIDIDVPPSPCFSPYLVNSSTITIE